MREWYYTFRWKQRAKAQLRHFPLCSRCTAQGRIAIAAIADHVIPHRGSWNEFWMGDLQSLCRNCHESSKKFEEARGYRSDIGADGWPLDPKHPTYQVRDSTDSK